MAPSGKALNGCEMLMQLIREVKSREGRGLNKKRKAGQGQEEGTGKNGQPKER